jgi:hypothetical protein
VKSVIWSAQVRDSCKDWKEWAAAGLERSELRESDIMGH